MAGIGLTQEAKRIPTVDDLINLRSVDWSTAISPNGRSVAYSISEPNIEKDTTTVHLWLADVDTGKSSQLTRGNQSCHGAQWSPDGAWLTYLSSDSGGRNQIFLTTGTALAPRQLTNASGGVTAFAWSPDGKTLAFTSAGLPSDALRARNATFGNYLVVGKDFTPARLYGVRVAEAMITPQTGELYSTGARLSVGGFSWSPDSTRLAFSASLVNGTPDVYVLDVTNGAVKNVAAQPNFDRDPAWSPDGRHIVFTSAMGRTGLGAYAYDLAAVPAGGGVPRAVTVSFDENPRFISWRPEGIYFWGRQRTAVHLFLLDPSTSNFKRISSPDALMAGGFSFSLDGRRVSFSAASPSALTEVFAADLPGFAARKLTNQSAQLNGLAFATPEVISWKNREGAEIEGVLVKPLNFDGKRKHPLICLLHGGPSETDQPALERSRYYPWEIWAARGAFVLRVNFRGSSGYGRDFRRQSYRNLGVADGADVLSGIDHLVAKGWIDPKRLGVAGWSHGGYLSAFLGVTTSRFAAVSVGAGFADAADLYYAGRGYIRDYFGATPSEDAEIYRKAAPITFAGKARTPTLLQHGDLDRTAPTDGGYKLWQELSDRGVPTEMLVYRGFGHAIFRPKAIRAAATHNLMWFGHYLWDDPAPDFTMQK